MRTAAERQDKIEALTIRYSVGEISEPVLIASLMNLVRDYGEIRHIIMMNQLAHRNSAAYKRGDIQ